MGESFKPHSINLFVFGAIILVVDWFIFNAGSTHSVHKKRPQNNVVATFVCTVLAASSGLMS